MYYGRLARARRSTEPRGREANPNDVSRAYGRPLIAQIFDVESGYVVTSIETETRLSQGDTKVGDEPGERRVTSTIIFPGHLDALL